MQARVLLAAMSLLGGLASQSVPVMAQRRSAAAVPTISAVATVEELTGEATVTVAEADHRLMVGERLEGRVRLRLAADARLVLRFEDGTQIECEPGATLILFGTVGRAPPRGPAPGPLDSTLLSGNVRVRRPDPGAGHRMAPFALHTAAGIVSPRNGVVLVLHDASRTTRVLVQDGTAHYRLGTRELVLRAGHTSGGVGGQPMFPPRALAAAPTWQSPPATRILAGSTGANLELSLRAAATQRVQEWRVELARDPAFHELVTERRVTSENGTVPVRGLVPGQYHLRVAAVATDGTVSLHSAAVPLTVAAPVLEPGAPGRRASIRAPEGFYCGLDGAALTVSTGAPQALLPGRAHRLRCAATADGQGAQELDVSAAEAGPLLHTVRVLPDGFSEAGGMRVLSLELKDAQGVPVSYANIQARLSSGASLERLVEGDQRGVYTATLRWSSGLRGLTIDFVINGAERIAWTFGQP